MDSNLAVVILAAGKGKRLGGASQKVLREILGKPMLLYLLDTIEKINPQKTIIIVGYKKEDVFKQLKSKRVEYAEQLHLKGTGDAVLQAKMHLENYQGDVLILCGDVPFITTKTINNLILAHRKTDNTATILTALIDNPTDYGRIKRDGEGRVLAIVEELSATAEEKSIKEINTGIYIFKKEPLFDALSKVALDEIKKEYYLTDVIKILSDEGKTIGTHMTETPEESLGINSVEDIEKATHFLLTGKEEKHE
ncbi:MAG: NTP transferase domain-containing protein [Elusimicrobia bacterium]|nr:NTP transferase domain-containing protein [Elusimicrobiota bacterium]